MVFRRSRESVRVVAAVAIIAFVCVAPSIATAGGILGPPLGAPFQYQLQMNPSGQFTASGGIEVGLCVRPVIGRGCVRAKVFSIDLYGANGVTPNVAAVRAIHRAGGYAICYVDAGTWESWRPDAHVFPRFLLGRSNGWPGERWLDIRKLKVLLPIMDRRVAHCQRAGFQAVDFDNVDGYNNDTGFALTGTEQISYNKALAYIAHYDHLAVGLKNDSGQARALEPWFNFAIEEQCVQYHFCAALASFVSAGKPVYDVEYVGNPSIFCRSVPSGFNVVEKAFSLFALPWKPCR